VHRSDAVKGQDSPPVSLSSKPTSSDISMRGVFFAVSAAIMWGIVPIYIGYVDADDPMEIVTHRALWSGVLLLGVIFFLPQMTGGIVAIRAALTSVSLRWSFLLSSMLLTMNWGIFVYAVQTQRVVEAALGYFIYPLVTVVLGILLLREKLDRWGWMAVAIVAGGVILKTQSAAGLPWISLVLAVTFGLYGVLRKRMGVDAVSGMFIETMLLFPPAILYLVWMQISGQPLFFGGGAANIGLAMAAGVVTVVPLILFHAGNKALPITIAGMLFYANPTTQLLIGLFYFDAPFPPQEWLNFGVIWAGLVVYFSTRRTET